MPCLSKLFNSILSSRLQKIFETNKFIHETQLGFQPKARISDQVLRKLIENHQSLNCKLYACFFFYFEKKAFDFVIHSVTFYKLCNAYISGLFYNVI